MQDTDFREVEMKNLFPSMPEDANLGHVYRAFPEKLGPLAEYQNRVMRGDSELSIAEREIIAAYVSGLNACAFCHGAHTVHAKAFGIDVSTIEDLMDDLESADIDDSLKPILAYSGKLTTSPSRMTEADAKAVYDAGWSENALFDAIQVCGLFNLMNRMLEGTGITEYHSDTNSAGEDVLDNLRSKRCYLDFGKANGLFA
ncbi:MULTISPECIES: carboxymuconolactone decarboxylase family protein [unclassified Ruegeria]|uniref:carboxymuconolactone decarboxylase family protein n=2 Tax=unclassified Ruegeria TaxID=2625375 RepID=UPI0020C37D01|nr:MULTISPECIES: peroxidase-related enzyme [unclassified Ruegeria]